ncbi:MAG: tail fiber domain-containing protein [Flavobacteriales bacterium]|nr:tail fiber domain-containing protein [Flavobacteriales bacterium]
MANSTGEVFRTISAAGVATNWRLFRGTDQIGRIFANGGTNLGFNLMQMERGGRLWLRNFGTGTADPGGVNTNGLSLPDDWNPAATPPSVNTLPLRRLGFFAMGHALTMQSPGNYAGMPWARLHLVHTQDVTSVLAAEIGWRWWMRNGLLITGNDDQMYVGHKYVGSYDDGTEVPDESDAVIQWSESELQEGRTTYDNCRFLFTTKLGDGGHAGTLDGLGLMRLRPYRDANPGDIEGFVGVGDWAGQGAEPEERLDVLDRTIMIRRLVPDYEDQTLRKFVVTDDDGRLHWRDISNLPDNCEWTMNGGPNSNNLYTAVGSATSCPGDANFVGIGTAAPTAKLTVNNTYAYGTFNLAGLFTVSTSQPFNVGLKTEATGSGTNHFGAQNWALNGSAETVGTYSRAYANNGGAVGLNTGVKSDCFVQSVSSVTTNVGVYATTLIQSSCTVGTNYGIRSDASNSSTSASTNYGGHFIASATNGASNNYGVYCTVGGTGTQQWALWANGDTHCTSGNWTSSDAMLKTNVQDITNGLDLLMQLQPKTYDFDLSTYGFMNLPAGMQYGFVAQDVQTVIPEMVREVTRPADLDSLGNVVQGEFTFKAIKYDALLPVLVAALKEQQVQLQALQQQVNDCCSGNGALNNMVLGATGAG